MENKEQLMTIKDLTEYLNVSESLVWKMIGRKTNPLPIITLSDKTKRARKQDIIDWMARNTLGGQPK